MGRYSLGTVLGCVLFALPVFAEEEALCNADTGLTNAEVVANIEARCCSKKSAKAQKNCITAEKKKLARAKDVFGLEFVTNAIADLNEAIETSCGDVVAEGSCIEASDVEATADALCCGLSTQGKRQACLNSAARKVFQTKKSIGGTFASEARATVRTISKAFCGFPEEEEPESNLKCHREMTVHDGGLGGFLHKPSGDHTSAIVVLLPSNLSGASACSYHRKDTGKEVLSFRSTGRANGNREHWRPQGDGSCSNLNRASKNKGLVFRCKIGSQYYCWGNKKNDGIKDSCDRED